MQNRFERMRAGSTHIAPVLPECAHGDQSDCEIKGGAPFPAGAVGAIVGSFLGEDTSKLGGIEARRPGWSLCSRKTRTPDQSYFRVAVLLHARTFRTNPRPLAEEQNEQARYDHRFSLQAFPFPGSAERMPRPFGHVRLNGKASPLGRHEQARWDDSNETRSRDQSALIPAEEQASWMGLSLRARSRRCWVSFLRGRHKASFWKRMRRGSLVVFLLAERAP